MSCYLIALRGRKVWLRSGLALAARPRADHNLFPAPKLPCGRKILQRTIYVEVYHILYRQYDLLGNVWGRTVRSEA